MLQLCKNITIELTEFLISEKVKVLISIFLYQVLIEKLFQ